jgi:hypothetical protein
MKEMRKPEVKSIEEMIEKNYTFYMNLQYNLIDNNTKLSEET